MSWQQQKKKYSVGQHAYRAKELYTLHNEVFYWATRLQNEGNKEQVGDIYIIDISIDFRPPPPPPPPPPAVQHALYRKIHYLTREFRV